MKAIKSALLGLALLAAAGGVQAQNEQFIPVLSYRVGPYAAGGSGYYGGAIDYWTLVNMWSSCAARVKLPRRALASKRRSCGSIPCRK